MASALIPAELQTADFYLKSMSLFLKGSFGMIDRMEMYLSVLQNVLETGDELILKHLDIWRTDEKGSPNYFDEDGPDADGTESRHQSASPGQGENQGGSAPARGNVDACEI